jgi:hypothetical protein
VKLTDLTIERFEASEVSEQAFTHEAHVYLGWLYVNEFGPNEANSRFDAALRRLVVVLGAESVYNAMITWLFMKLIAERTRPNEPWSAFRARNLDLIEGRPRSGEG